MRIINTYREPVPPGKVLTEAEIMALCCEVVPVDECSEVGRVSVYEGADEKHRNFDPEQALAEARAANPRARIIGVRVEGIGPPAGAPCGKLYESWEGRNNCCDGVPVVAIDRDVTPDVLPHGRSIIISWAGGSGSYQVTTSSNATWFSDGRRSASGTGNSIQLFAGETFCGNTAVVIDDGCSSAAMIIRSDLGSWYPAGPCVLDGHNAGVADIVGMSATVIYGDKKQTETFIDTAMIPTTGAQGVYHCIPCPQFVDPSSAGCLDDTNTDCLEMIVADMCSYDAQDDTCLHYPPATRPTGIGNCSDSVPVVETALTNYFVCTCPTSGQGYGNAVVHAKLVRRRSVSAGYVWRC